MQVDTPVGNTLPDMVVTVILCLIVEKAAGAVKSNRNCCSLIILFFRMWYVADSGKRGQMKKFNLKKLTVTAILAAVAVVGSLFSFPVFGSKCAPVQHLVNILCAVTVGPWWALAQAFIAALIRNLLGLGSPLAFPGSMCGALLGGLLYKYGKKLPFAYIGEVVGTGIIGGMLSYPVAYLVMGNKAAALFTFVVPFLISTCGGTIIAIIITLPLKKSGMLGRMKESLEE